MSIRQQLADPHLPPEEEDRLIGAFIRQHGRDELRARYEEKYRQLRQPATVKSQSMAKVRRLYFFLSGAAVCGLLVFLYTSPTVFGNGRQDRLLAQYLTVADHYTPTSRDTDGTLLSTDLYANFRAQRYQAVVDQTATATDPAARYYRALAFIALNQFAQAITVLQHFSPAEEFAADANWYLTLLLLQDGETATARTRLQTYTPEDGLHYRQAQALLKTLE
ncbi:hypothetical protein LEM8419_00782 [Neolewinella maritima]|uniref:Tetratricopeptide repeat protein n=1 Tax=Neolewinella maritima TaxID=1383882 RepID=A0ABM9AXP5_9BACT|nr:hypothetical protein [Neolewinella maritima]CAH0999482.1 hypothetical protein LEM8419_00782 [Neolewinella maritima]